MGREIRRVPLGWEHPIATDDYGRTDFRPMLDMSFDDAYDEWYGGMQEWLRGTHKYQNNPHDEDKAPTIEAYCRYVGLSPDPDDYRPNWTPEQASGFQIYETVTEGTPVSPVFATKAEMEAWLVGNWNMTPEQAHRWAKTGWSPTLVRVSPDGGWMTGEKWISGKRT